MKKFKLVFTIVLSVVFFNLQAQTGSAEITFKEKVKDFGIINEGDVVETVFEFTNTGDAPLQLSAIKASCGCTVPSNWTTEPIQPGEESSFTVKFDSNNKPNRQSKSIRVESNAKRGVESVTFQVIVTPDPEKEAVRVAQAEQRQEQYRLQKEKALENEKLADNKDASSLQNSLHKKEITEKTKLEKERRRVEAAKKDLSDDKDKVEKEVRELKKERKKIEKETEKLEKVKSDSEKDLKKAAKEEKKAAKKEAKESKKLAKKTAKIEKASEAVADSKDKIAKIAAKMKKTETKGDLSPNEKLEYESKIAKLTQKLEKEKKALVKLQGK